MSRLPIRVRLTVAFALSMVAVLVGAGALVFSQVRADLNDSIDTSLRAQAEAVAARGSALSPAADPEEGFAQIAAPSGRVIDAAGGARGFVLGRATLVRAAQGPVLFRADVPGIEGTARVLARPAASRIVVVGQSLDDRDETLAALLTAFALGGPLAVAVASLVGYLLAAAGLAPVEAMRRRAAEVSLESGEQLPLPVADDEIRRLAETLNGMLARLRATFERERQFVADAGHELRTPLAVIKTELEAALRNEPDSEVRASLAAALEESDHLAQLAEDLLVLARAGERGLEVRPERLEVRPFLDGVRDRFVDRARQRGRTIAVSAPAGLYVQADPLRMRQALSNLLDNALRHGAGPIELVAKPLDGGLELTVADAGPGFEPAIAGTAFERFSRGDAARTRGGAGLGLAIVRAIARAHGGEAEIADARSGAVVRIRLPVAGERGLG